MRRVRVIPGAKPRLFLNVCLFVRVIYVVLSLDNGKNFLNNNVFVASKLCVSTRVGLRPYLCRSSGWGDLVGRSKSRGILGRPQGQLVHTSSFGDPAQFPEG